MSQWKTSTPSIKHLNLSRCTLQDTRLVSSIIAQIDTLGTPGTTVKTPKLPRRYGNLPSLPVKKLTRCSRGLLVTPAIAETAAPLGLGVGGGVEEAPFAFFSVLFFEGVFPPPSPASAFGPNMSRAEITRSSFVTAGEGGIFPEGCFRITCFFLRKDRGASPGYVLFHHHYTDHNRHAT